MVNSTIFIFLGFKTFVQNLKIPCNFEGFTTHPMLKVNLSEALLNPACTVGLLLTNPNCETVKLFVHEIRMRKAKKVDLLCLNRIIYYHRGKRFREFINRKDILS